MGRQSTGKYRHFSRADRVADLIMREVGTFLLTKINDPRIGFATVVKVKVSPDLRLSRIYVSVMGDEQRKREAMMGLVSATGYVQKAMAGKLGLRFTPKVTFYLDESMDYAERINAMLKELNE